jgi:1,2-diacylglycerol 3-beta-galactosyltransferase
MCVRTTTPTILILTADAGMGHRSAANAIASALKDYAFNVVIANPLDSEPAPALLKRSESEYDRLVQRLPEVYRAGYTFTEEDVPRVVIEAGALVLLAQSLHQLLRKHRPAVVVHTFSMFQAAVHALMVLERRQVPTVTVVTDLGTVHRSWFFERTTSCVVPSPAAYQRAIECGMRPGQAIEIGIPVNPQLTSGAAQDVVRCELGWPVDKRTLLLIHSKRAPAQDALISCLNHSKLDLHLAIVAAGDDAFHDRMIRTDWHVPCNIYNFVNNMPELLRAADIISSKAGGLIVSEALAAGRPMLLTSALPGQEEGNVGHVLESGSGAFSVDPIRNLETLYHWLDADGAQLRSVSTKARAIGKPNAAHEIAQLVASMVGRDVRANALAPAG